MSKRRIGDTEVRKLLRAARRAGLVYVHGGKHLRLLNPATPERFVTVSGTPSSPHAVQMIRADIRRTLGVCL